ncbi:MAG: uroporphyrinogen-III synthase [Nitratireductor sp.]|nr:uroporphyrinogen-III synthase [Nitratireductor sp.]MCC0021099.1 uroporphyrinogen-III synthase [Nitratireductor sp.]
MKVLLTRTEDGNRRTARKLAALGFEAISLPLSELGATGKSLPGTHFDGIIFTSASAIATLPAETASQFSAKPAFAVGEKTAKAALEAGFDTVVTGAGDAAALSQTILQHFEGRTAHLAYPSGTERAFDMEGALEGSGITLTLAETYSVERLSPPVERLGNALGSADAAFFYSPAAARHFTGIVSSAGLEASTKRIHAVAISPNVAAELGMFGHVQVAQWPNEASMLDALQKLAGGQS